MFRNLEPLEKFLGLKFKDKKLLIQAFVHRSYLNEHRNFPIEHNERLEFLGDAVLELVVTEHLYRQYSNPEGDLTNWRAALVNSRHLAVIARELNLENFLYLSRGESKEKNTKGREQILANTLEALLGAIYLEFGFKEVKNFVHRHILSHLPYILENKLFLDAKSRFQEAAQDKLGITPQYRVLEERGPDHARKFKVGVYLGEELIAAGEGLAKQEAQMQAAEKALAIKNW